MTWCLIKSELGLRIGGNWN